MSEGVRRLSLLLGILGACAGVVFGWAYADGVYRTLQEWRSYDQQKVAYDTLLTHSADTITAWESANEHVSADGSYKFVKADSGQGFSDALQAKGGTWYQWVKSRPTKSRLGMEYPPCSGPEAECAWKSFEEIGFFAGISLGAQQTMSELARPPGIPEPPLAPYSPRPGFLVLLQIAAWPVLGFLVPWGSFRVFGWVIMGFVLDWRGRR